MGQRLVDVMSTDDKGLIGFTENGEEIKLSSLKIFLSSKGNTKEKILSGLQDQIYAQFGYPVPFEGYIPYNIYTKRE